MEWLIGAAIVAIILTYFYKKNYVPFIIRTFRQHAKIAKISLFIDLGLKILILVTEFFIIFPSFTQRNTSLIFILANIAIFLVTLFLLFRRIKKRLNQLPSSSKEK